MEPTKEVEPSCNTCKHHVQGGLIADAPGFCWDCVDTRSLPHWEPIELEPRPLTRTEYATLHLQEPGGITSDGSTASYYELPDGATELQDLIAHRNMNAQIGEIFRECYRYGQASHCDELRGIKKIIFYAEAEKKRLENQRKEPSC